MYQPFRHILWPIGALIKILFLFFGFLNNLFSGFCYFRIGLKMSFVNSKTFTKHWSFFLQSSFHRCICRIDFWRRDYHSKAVGTMCVAIIASWSRWFTVGREYPSFNHVTRTTWYPVFWSFGYQKTAVLSLQLSTTSRNDYCERRWQGLLNTMLS